MALIGMINIGMQMMTGGVSKGSQSVVKNLLSVFAGIVGTVAAAWWGAQAAIKATAIASAMAQAMMGPAGWMSLGISLGAGTYAAYTVEQILSSMGNSLAPAVTGMPNPSHQPPKPVQAPAVPNHAERDLNELNKETKQQTKVLKGIHDDLIMRGKGPELKVLKL
jgi:hypothetical protein